MSITASEMTPADIGAVVNGCNGGNNGNDGMFGNGAWWIIVLFLFAWGRGGFGGFGGFGGGYDGSQGAVNNYVLASDFATLQRQIDSVSQRLEGKGDQIINGLCDGFYTQAQLINGVNMNIAQNGYESRLATQQLGSQMMNCCCDIRAGIADVNYNNAMNANAIQRQISDCCCDASRQIERGFCDTNYNMASQNNATLQAIDKVGDRVIDYLSQQESQRLRDDNFALRLAASQARQNELLIDRLGDKCPQPAYVVQPPQNVTFPTNCCGGVTYSNGGCGCN